MKHRIIMRNEKTILEIESTQKSYNEQKNEINAAQLILYAHLFSQFLIYN